MIPANRTYLLQLREKKHSYAGSLHILQARRQALISELFQMTRSFLSSQEEIRNKYAAALASHQQAYIEEGTLVLRGIAAAADKEKSVVIRKKTTLGIEYKEIELLGRIRRDVNARGYALGQVTPHLDESISLFEEVVSGMVGLAIFENKLKRLGEKIIDISRKVRILDEKIIPQLDRQMHVITQQISEREREEHFRLKQFKRGREKKIPA